jgi:hypothetical protein
MGRNFWTFTRFSIGFGPSFAALTLVQGVAPMTAAALAFVPSLASAAITYHSGAFGKFLTNGSWAKWLLNSDKKFAKILRRGIGLNPINFEKYLVRNRKFLLKARPDLFKNNPELFEKRVRRATQDVVNSKVTRVAKIAKRLNIPDEYLKQFVSESGFVALTLKVPNTIAGVGVASGSLLDAAGDVLKTSTMGLIAQAPGDLAIHKRKFQKFDKLFEDVTSGKIQVENKAQLLEDFAKMRDPKIAYTVGKNSHKALKRIENWARSRAIAISFFSVAGATMETVGIPFGRPILVSLGVGGAAYYGNVNGWITKEKIKYIFSKKFITDLKKTRFFSLSGLISRLCEKKFSLKHLRI